MEMTQINQIGILTQKIEELKELIQQHATPLDKTRSNETKELFTALAKAQAEMQEASTNNTNPYFKSKYADMAEITRASRPALTKYGLSVIQQILPNDDGQIILHTILCHASGQWFETRMAVVPPKNDIQTLGSYITYLRRYTYSALVGIVTADEDDDGEIAVATSRELKAKGTALNTKYNAKENKYETISKDQIDELEYELSDYPDIVDMILDGLKIQSIGDMPKEKFMTSIQRIREIKLLRKGR